jgi:ABC-type branched-subunit amino acid transport system permease subunit
LFLNVTQQILRTQGQYATLLYGLLLILVFMYLPSGLIGLARGAARRMLA